MAYLLRKLEPTYYQGLQMHATPRFLRSSALCVLCVGLSLSACGKLAKKSDGTASVDAGSLGPLTRFIGRVDATNPNLVLMAWPGTAAETRFNGSTVTATVAMAAPSIANPTRAQTFVELTIDGSLPQRVLLNVTGSTQVTATVTKGLHTARLTKVTEAGFGTITFGGFTTDGSFTNTLLPTRKIAFVGDSITAGLGILGTTPTCPSLDPNVEEVRAAYSVVTATQLNADYSILAWSGKGVYKNLDGNDTVTMPALYGLINPTDTASAYTFALAAADQPKVVLINLGTNDFYFFANKTPSALPDQAGYTAALTQLAKTVRSHYGDAHIILALGPITSDYPSGTQVANQLTTWRAYVKAVVDGLKAAGDSKVTSFEFPPLSTDAQKGCDSHPNVAAAQVMATALVAEVKSLTGWN
jgi:lysophospholipase L1-like esterase